LEFLDAGKLPFVRPFVLEVFAINQFDGVTSANDASRQPHLAIAAATDAADQFIIGDLRWRSAAQARRVNFGPIVVGQLVLHGQPSCLGGWSSCRLKEFKVQGSRFKVPGARVCDPQQRAAAHRTSGQNSLCRTGRTLLRLEEPRSKTQCAIGTPLVYEPSPIRKS